MVILNTPRDQSKRFIASVIIVMKRSYSPRNWNQLILETERGPVGFPKRTEA